VPKSTFDPSVVATDLVVKRIVSEIIDGIKTAYDFQKVLDELQIKDVIITLVGQPTCDGVKGKITLVITIVGTRTLTEIKTDLNRAIVKIFEIPAGMTLDTTLEKDTSSKKKRQGSDDTFLQTTVITPADPSALPEPSPSTTPPPPSPYVAAGMINSGFVAIWLVSLLSLLFLRG
jgi:hypothetical protein